MTDNISRPPPVLMTTVVATDSQADYPSLAASRGTKNTGTRSSDIDWPTPRSAVPMQASGVDPIADRVVTSAPATTRDPACRALAGS